MIRINLLNDSRLNKDKKKISPVIPLGAAGLILVIGVISMILFTRKPEVPKEVLTENKGIEVTDFKPSTHARSAIVEDVVRELSHSESQASRKGVLDIPYQEMSVTERINYEVLFGKKVFEVLSRAVPDGIGLKTLEIENFQTVYALGISSQRDEITQTFSAFRQERMELLPKPHSYITSNPQNGYRFVVTCKAELGLDLSDPFQATDQLPPRADLPVLLKTITDLASQVDVKFKADPVQVSAERAGAYRRFVYRYTGTSTYKDFVRLVLRLNQDRVPCAFKKVTIKARTETVTDVSAEILLTLKD